MASSLRGAAQASSRRSSRGEVHLFFSGLPETGERAGLVLHVPEPRELRRVVVSERRRPVVSARIAMTLGRTGMMPLGSLYAIYTLERCCRVLSFELRHTSCGHPAASLSQLGHPSSEQSTQLRSTLYSSRGCVADALVAIASSPIPRNGWCKASWRFRHARHWRCPSQRRWPGAAGDLANHGRGSIICDSLLQGSTFVDIG